MLIRTCSQLVLVTISLSRYITVFLYHYYNQANLDNRMSISLWCLCLDPATKRQRAQNVVQPSIPNSDQQVTKNYIHPMVINSILVQVKT